MSRDKKQWVVTKAIDSGMKEKGLGRSTVDGADGGVWAVMDYGDFVVHVMNEESREFYRLESLWVLFGLFNKCYFIIVFDIHQKKTE